MGGPAGKYFTQHGFCTSSFTSGHFSRYFQSIAQQIKRKQKSLCGFTLTEVIVASALLITAIVPILKALTSVHVNAITIERKTRSLNLAQAKLDDIKARSFYNYDVSFAENNNSIDGSYLSTVTDKAVNTDLRMLVVTVGYDTDSNKTLAASETLVTLETYIARKQ